MGRPADEEYRTNFAEQILLRNFFIFPKKFFPGCTAASNKTGVLPMPWGV